MTTKSVDHVSARTKGQEKQLWRFMDDLRHLVLGEAKNKEMAQQLISNFGKFQADVLKSARQHSAKEPYYTTILGDDFITPEEVTRARPDVVYTANQLGELMNSIPSAEDLRWCKEHGYAVMPAPSTAMSLNNVRSLNPVHFYTKTGGWYANENFADYNRTKFGWLAVSKIPVTNSPGMTWADQNKLLHSFERVPNAAEMSWFVTTYFEVRKVRLFERIYVRCSDLGSGGRRVIVGSFDSRGLYVSDYWDDRRDDTLGLSAARK